MSHNSFSRFVGLCLMVLVFIGCSFVGFHKTTQDTPEKETFDPLIYPDDIDLDAELFPGEKTISTSGYRYTPMSDSLRDWISEPDTAGAMEDTTKPRKWIYQIEVFSSPSRQEVMAKKDEVQRRVEYPVTIVFEAPFYRVRVGNLATIYEAETLRSGLKKMGYRSAFWVRRSPEEE